MNPISEKKYYRSLSPIINPCDLAYSKSWNDIFNRKAPMDIEIGFGNGEYLARLSESFPQRDFVGLEVSWGSLKRALRRLNNPPRTNVRLAHLGAFPALKHLFAPRSLSIVRALFPIPWPNEKHSQKRIFNRDFLTLLANRLKDDGQFYLVTDHCDLAQWTMQEAKGSDISLELVESPALLDTKYERKWLSGGQQTFYHLTGHKTGHPSVPAPGLNDMQPMYSNFIDPNKYQPKSLTGDPAVIFGNFIYDPRQSQGLLAAKVVENNFIQEFHIRVELTHEGRWKLAPALVHQIIPTSGVKLALSLAALEEPLR